MTAGGITQLHANGDSIFCLNPQITYFKSVYRKYTKFIVSDYEKTPDHSNNFSSSSGDDLIFTFPTQGELLSKVSIRIKKDNNTVPIKLPDNIGTVLFDKVDLIYD